MPYELEFDVNESGENIITFLSSPIKNYFENYKKKESFSKKWNKQSIEIYNNYTEYLQIGQLCNKKGNNIFNNNFFTNYINLKKLINTDSNSEIINIKTNIFTNNRIYPSIRNFINEDNMTDYWYNLKKEIINNNHLGKYNNTSEIFIEYDIHNLKKIVRCINKAIFFEINNKKKIQEKMLLLITVVFQYLNIFDDKSINLNLWNYCLCSMKKSKKYLFVGILTVISQFIWTFSIVYNVIKNYENTGEDLILVITIVSTVVSLLYSYSTIHSFNNSRVLYKFIFKLYDDFPNLINNHDRELNPDNSFIDKITMTKRIIHWNYYADLFSNFILPIIMPIINFFIVYNSESVFDAILNSIAVFFIIQIDEELFTITPYERDRQNYIFAKYLMEIIYNNINPTFVELIELKKTNNFKKVFDLALEYKIKNNL